MEIGSADFALNLPENYSDLTRSDYIGSSHMLDDGDLCEVVVAAAAVADVASDCGRDDYEPCNYFHC